MSKDESSRQERLLGLGKVPKWLEDLSNNVRNARPGSWKIGLGLGPNVSSPNLESSHLHNKPRNDVSSENNFSGRSRPASMMDNLTLDLRRLSCGEEDTGMSRDGSAKHGRRAVSDTYTRSVGNSPRTNSLSVEDSFTFNTQSPLKENVLLNMGNKSDVESTRSKKLTSQSAITRPRRFCKEPEEKDRCQEESWNSLNLFNVKQKGRLSRESEEKYSAAAVTSVDVTSNRHNTFEHDACDAHLCDDYDPDEMGPRPTSDFIIPELPAGIQLDINIRSTWGDRHYLGLNGIELFAQTGEPVSVNKIWAVPSDINELPEYGKDPRVVANLLDGVNRTHDDMHLWLAPFTENADHLVHIRFSEEVHLAMLRIWNYNKSRIHSYRGARDVDITLDGVPVFRGEIARACGGLLGGMEAFGDTILFTTDDSILELISQHDDNFNKFLTDVNQDLEKFQIERPVTGYRGDDRPFTGTVDMSGPSWSPEARDSNYESLLGGQQLQLTLLANWGHPFCIGLTGLEVFDSSGSTIPLDPRHLRCDDRSPDAARLVDGCNVTTDESCMWRTDFSEGRPVALTVDFPSTVYVAGVRLWNYNGPTDTTYCGVKLLTISLDSGPACLHTVRRAPGNCHFDFVQELPTSPPVPPAPDPRPLRESYIGDRASGDAPREYEAPVMPQGFVFQLLILSTWGDSYYVGLNGLELYDHTGERIALTENNIEAFPDSVNVLEGVNDDVRTPDKLVDGVNETMDGRHMWLAPILPDQLNRIYVIFDYPVTVSMIKLWNYSKTTNRGIKEFGVLVDDLLVYNGVLDRFSNKPREVAYRTVLFTTDESVLQRERPTEVRDSSYGRDVEFLNEERRVTSGGSSHLSADQSKRPHTSIHSRTSRSKSLYDLL